MRTTQRSYNNCSPRSCSKNPACIPRKSCRLFPNTGYADGVLLLRELVHDYQLRRSDVNDNVSFVPAGKLLLPASQSQLPALRALDRGYRLFLLSLSVEDQFDW